MNLKLNHIIAPQTILDISILSFGLWTLGTSIAVVTNSSLFVATVITAVLTVLFWWLWQKLPDQQTKKQIKEYKESDSGLNYTPLRIGLIAVGVSLFCFWIYQRDFYYLWLSSLIILTTQVFYLRRSGSVNYIESIESAAKHSEKLIWFLAMVGAFVALIAHRPDSDDSYYLNQAAVVANGFFQAIPTHFTIFPGSDIPAPYPSWIFISYHYLIGLLSWLLHLEPLAVSAYVLTPVLSLLVILAYSVLLKTLLPKGWSLALAGLTGFMLIDGTAPFFFSNFAFVRIWQGKSVLLHVIRPVLITYGLWFGVRGGAKNWIRLTLAQTTAVGLSSLGIWISPVVACVSIFTAMLGTRFSPTRFGLGILTCFYPVIIGIYALQGSHESLSQLFSEPELNQILLNYFGSFKAEVFWFGMMLISAYFAPNLKARWFFSTYSLAILLTFLNPYFTIYIAKYITSSIVFWRVMWLLPLVIMGAASLCVSFTTKFEYERIVTIIWSIILVLGYAIIVPGNYVLSKANRVTVSQPFVKVRRERYKVGRFLTDSLPPGSSVIAPEEISWFLPTFKDFLYPLAPKRIIIDTVFRKQQRKLDEFHKRLYVTDYTEGLRPVDSEYLLQVIEEFQVRGIVTTRNTANHQQLSSILTQDGFKLVQFREYDVWLK
ncbi:MAG: DUF6077 domain-containing protein [Cyanobacteria bacterium P01_A01_bin.40]